MPSCPLISFRRMALGLRSTAKMASSIASCSGLTLERFRLSLGSLLASPVSSDRLLMDGVALGDEAGEGVPLADEGEVAVVAPVDGGGDDECRATDALNDVAGVRR